MPDILDYCEGLQRRSASSSGQTIMRPEGERRRPCSTCWIEGEVEVIRERTQVTHGRRARLDLRRDEPCLLDMPHSATVKALSAVDRLRDSRTR
jgi:hypothetical protein